MTEATDATRRANEAVLVALTFDDVTDGISQVRNLDLATMSFIRGETAWIVIDNARTIYPRDLGVWFDIVTP